MEEKHYTDDNTIIELSSVSEDTLFDENESQITKVTEEEIKVKPSKKQIKKPKKEFFWNKLSKKGKIIILVIAAFVIILIGALLLYFLVFKEEEKTPQEPVENIVIEKDNYIYDNGKLKLLNSKDEVIGIYTCVNADVDKCYVASLTNEDEFDIPIYMDEDDNLIEKKSKIYNDRFVFIFDEERIVLYDIEKETKTGEYSLIKTGALDADLIVAKNIDGKYGLIEFTLTDANTVLDFTYDYLGIISSDSTFVAKDGTYSYLVDKTGKTLTSKIRGNIRNFSNKYMAVYEDGYSLYDYQGQKVLEDLYDYIDFANNYIFTITNKKIYAYDTELFKLNESGIKVKNEDYNKTYIFDEENNLKETKKAYNITFTSSAITFELSDETTKTINLNEVAINKKTDYVNYIDGVLYFYRDIEKTDMIGSYSCTNENKVTSSESAYETCFIAKDSTLVNKDNKQGYIPIINDNFVFIRDTKEGATKETVVLYDIKNSSQKVKYQAVETGVSADTITFISALDSLVFAKNNDGNLGVITFTESGPKGLISFKEENEGTKDISYLGNYLLVQRGNKNYLYTKTGELLASSQFAIKEYRNDYLVVKDKKYLVYKLANSDTGSIISEELDHVELFDDFFVGVINKKLNVYSYENGKTKLLAEDLEITADKIADGYKMAIHSDSYVISIVQGENATVDYKYSLEDWSLVTNEEE
ncbi:MAG: hypothetical protein E7167_04195 [Firmicutes bacterium]|nr:hypothetical protein [Bacillota bacterium]